MLESHEIQKKIIFDVKTYTCPSYGKFCNESHRLATLQLQVELLNWRSCFIEYVGAQKGYIEALHGWLSKFVPPEVENHGIGRAAVLNGPPLLTVCRDWLGFIKSIPDKSVSFAIKSCAKDVHALWLQQGAEQQQKRKVDSLSKELDKKMSTFQKVENRLEFRLTDKNEHDIEHGVDSLMERKDMLENFKTRVEFEKEKHQKLMQETERITLNGFQAGFCRVFESMTEFSRAALKMYNDLSTREKTGKESSCIEGAEMEGNGNG